MNRKPNLRNTKPSGTPIRLLIEVMERLRDPVNGCPWDTKQNFDSIAPYTVEEAYEVLDAIERQDMVDLKEELGDLLLQVVFHAQMADELGEFNFDDVAKASAEKMVRRHPHVFDNSPLISSAEQAGAWEDQKERERERSKNKNDRSTLSGIAKDFPALLRAYKLQKRAARVNFDWPSVTGALNKLKEEIEELEVELSSTNLAENNLNIMEEVSDVIFSAANVARKLNIEPEAALRAGNKKFERRFRYIEEMLLEEGKDIKKVSLEDMEIHWKDAKTLS